MEYRNARRAAFAPATVPTGRWRRLAGAVLLAAALQLGVSASASAQLAEEGQQIFEQQCAACHTIGGGQLVGPDLQGVTDRLGSEETGAFILDPAGIRPGTAMPNLGLTQAQVDALVAFLETTGAGATTEPAPPAEPAPAQEPAPTGAPAAGDALVGHDLFTGDASLQNGGPPCLSCHQIAGVGSLGGGNVGPDLTGAFAKYNGTAGLTGVLTTIAFPTMQPVYANQGLTEAEVANLVAFIEEAQQLPPPGSPTGKLVGLAFGGIAAFALLAFAVWRGRLLAVRRPLVNRSSARRR